MYLFVQNIKVLTIALCVLQAFISFGQDVFIKGKVTNGDENLSSAMISLGRLSVLTDENGDYSFSIQPGHYMMTVALAGYETAERSVSIKDGEPQIIDIVLIPIYQLGEVVLLGSRSNIKRSNLNTATPVDGFPQKILHQTGEISLTQMLNFIAPSLNASGEALNEPITLRGLDPDHVLILLNGTRYHNTAWINGGNLKGQLGRGSVGNDLNSIPPSSIEKIEVLRDGASAQYGSDAIAGVINIILKESTDETLVNWHQGQFYNGDGEKYALGINHGISLSKKGQKGFINLSGDFRYQAATHRGGQYDGTVYYEIPKGLSLHDQDSLLLLDNQMVSERGFDRQKAVDQVGNSKFVVAGILANGAYPIHNRMEVFWTAAFNNRKVYREQVYRFPKNKTRVNSELYPDGFQPLSKTTTTDISLISGFRGEFRNSWYWDLTASLGTNTLRSDLSNTNNASQSYLGKEAPTSFYNGTTVYEQLTNNFNISKHIAVLPVGVNSVNFSAGLEWRLETLYERPGDEASWKNYDNTYRTQPGTGGINPDYAINKDRNDIGIYVDLETELNNCLLINLASRYEYYNDFGGNLAGKLAVRYKLGNHFALRASVSNGFRAPSLQQRYTTSISETQRNIGGVFIAAIRGVFPNDHNVIKALGVPSLTAEKSINLSGGFTLNIKNCFSFTADAYWIQLKDRIVLSGTFFRNNNPTLDNILNQYPEFIQIDQLAFFANAINTHTKGMDMVLQGSLSWDKSLLNFMLASNFTQTHLYGSIKAADKLPEDALNTNSIINMEERTKIEKGQPNSKIVLTIDYQKGKTRFVVNNTRFGRTAIAPIIDANNGIFLSEKFSSKIITDVKINYEIKNFVSVGAGVNNLFNVYPDKIKNYENTAQGVRIYSPEGSPFGFNGGYYFMNASFNF